MREILFRAKHIHALPQNEHLDGTWVYGYLCDENYINTVDEDEYGGKFTSEMLIDPETVCQYIGLTDKNGRKIFEGDILFGEKYHDWGQGGEYVPDKCIIKWNEKRAAFDPVYWWEGYNHDLKCYEVIGNIFDNPELLKGDTNGKTNSM